MLDITGYLDDHINNMTGHSVPHAFSFTKDTIGQKLKFDYKDWALDCNWKTVDYLGGMEHNFFNSFPKNADIPRVLQPNVERLKLDDLLPALKGLHNTGKVKLIIFCFSVILII